MSISDELREQLRACSKDEAAFYQLLTLFEQAQTPSDESDQHAAFLEQEKLRVALQKERELNDLKTRMMVRISHEFRTPLAAILSSSELLERYFERLSPESRRTRAQRIRAEVFHIADMLNDISLAIRDDLIAPEYASLDLEQLCQTAIDRVRQTTGVRHHLALAMDGDLRNVAADPDLMNVIVTHLLSNAVKFSPAGTTVQLTLSGVNGHVRLSVQDQGIGIPAGEQRRIFEPFFRGSNIGETGGIGLGLSLVNRAVTALRGRIDLESVPQQGTTFTVTLAKYL